MGKNKEKRSSLTLSEHFKLCFGILLISLSIIALTGKTAVGELFAYCFAYLFGTFFPAFAAAFLLFRRCPCHQKEISACQKSFFFLSWRLSDPSFHAFLRIDFFYEGKCILELLQLHGVLCQEDEKLCFISFLCRFL